MINKKEKQEKKIKSGATVESYDTILSPVITEKATMASQYNQVSLVSINSSKPEIKKAVEKIFGVQVIGINTIRVKGKLRRFKGKIGRTAAFKKTIVTLKEGDTIDVTTNIQ